MAVHKKRGAKLLAKSCQEKPDDVLDELYLGYCDAETDSSRGHYMLHRGVMYWIDSQGRWIPSLIRN